MLWSSHPDCFSLLSARSAQSSHCFSLPSYSPPPLLSSSLLQTFLPISPIWPPFTFPPFLAFFLLFQSLPSLSWPFLSLLAFPLTLQMEKLLLPAVDLEQWYQELMAGLGTGLAAASPRSSPPPLPAKASRQLQVTLTPTSSAPVPICSEYLLPILPAQWGHGVSSAPMSREDNKGLFLGSHIAILVLWAARGSKGIRSD